MIKIVGATIEPMNLKEQAIKGLEDIAKYCRENIATKIPGEVIRIRMLDEYDQHSMFSVNGDGEVWYLPGDSDTGYYFDPSRKDNIFQHWEELLPFFLAWPDIRLRLEQEISARAANAQN